MTTYDHMLKVSKDQTLTNSEKLHELFKDSKTEPMTNWIAKWASSELFGRYTLPPAFPADAQVLSHDGDGQILIARFNDNTYHLIDSGLWDANDNIIVIPFNDIDQETMDDFWDAHLATDDTPMAFYRGGFIDQDLEHSFLNSFPES